MTNGSPERRAIPPRTVILVAALVAALVAGCGDDASGPSGSGSARLQARPGTAGDPVGPGRYSLQGQPGFFAVPPDYQAGEPTPMIVLLHGAGGTSESWEGVRSLADSVGVALLVPESGGSTWDGIRGDFGPDVRALDDALEQVFGRVDVDPGRLALGGFSDGASYALSLGLANGDLFTHVMAFSPGFIRNVTRRGQPEIFVTHGTADPILPIDQASRSLVPALRASGYDVTYREFDGGHVLPRTLAREAFMWLVGPG